MTHNQRVRYEFIHEDVPELSSRCCQRFPTRFFYRVDSSHGWGQMMEKSRKCIYLDHPTK